MMTQSGLFAAGYTRRTCGGPVGVPSLCPTTTQRSGCLPQGSSSDLRPSSRRVRGAYLSTVGPSSQAKRRDFPVLEDAYRGTPSTSSGSRLSGHCRRAIRRRESDGECSDAGHSTRNRKGPAEAGSHLIAPGRPLLRELPRARFFQLASRRRQVGD